MKIDIPNLHVTDNRTSQAMAEMAKNAKKGFVFLNDVAPIAAKYKRMEKVLQLISTAEGDVSNYYIDEAQEALEFDPLLPST